ncbi:glutamine amidotransferase subunit pdxT [Leptodontidium sp. 2 PMI_412]|nr:glutamine amidotransferase subunit pdxT [Leptodontidium sp. MPI-SDFR-AT-0119]KAH9208819.1 glutamine amidotransferase subunit pdxT [Leptodontidium sp. 2 PMI_412]
MMEKSNTVTFSLEGEPEVQLLGTYTRYSSWTARVVTVLEYFRIPYRANYVQLADVKQHSKSGFVPILIPLSWSPSLEINDSLSICEFLAESYPTLGLWPQDRELRALARSAVAEMHSGFGEIRNTYHTNFVAKYEGNVPVSEKGKKEIERMLALWDQARNATIARSQALGEKDEGYLFGKFGIADAFFWPVLWRFRTYNLPLTTASPGALAWMKTMWSDPTLLKLSKDYFSQAENPKTAIAHYDDIFKGNPGIQYGRFEEDWKFEY